MGFVERVQNRFTPGLNSGTGGSHSHCLGKKDMQLCFLFFRSIILQNPCEAKSRQLSASSKVIPGSAKNQMHSSSPTLSWKVMPSQLGCGAIVIRCSRSIFFGRGFLTHARRCRRGWQVPPGKWLIATRSHYSCKSRLTLSRLQVSDALPESAE